MHRSSRRSHTAEGAAALRAAGAREVDLAVRNPDYLAERLIGGVYRLRVRWRPVRTISLRFAERLLPGLYLFVAARTKHFDAVLLDEVRAGAEQVVIIGAGADSRAYRFADRLRGVDVVELDHPATGTWKQRQVRRLFGDLPAHVRYVAVDFGSDTLEAALDRAGVRRGVRTFFLWEGVTMYLSPDAVGATLAAVARFAPGSSVVFDYFYRDAIEAPPRYPEAVKYATYLRRRGEPLVFGLNPDDVAGYLARYGLTLTSHTRAEDLGRQHLAGSDGEPVGRHLSFSGIAHAGVSATVPADPARTRG